MLAQAPNTPVTPPQSPELVAPVPVRTGTRSWDIRNRKRQWAAWGYTEPMAKAQIYNARKTERSNARKEWVLQHGYTIPVPQSLWPKYPSGEYRPWVPPKHLLTLEQEAQPMCAKYMEQLELIEVAAAEAAAEVGFGFGARWRSRCGATWGRLCTGCNRGGPGRSRVPVRCRVRGPGSFCPRSRTCCSGGSNPHGSGGPRALSRGGCR